MIEINYIIINKEIFRKINLYIVVNHHGIKIKLIQNILAHRRIALAAKILR